MSLPTFADYPDYLRVNQQAGGPLLPLSPVHVLASVALGPFFVGPWAAVGIRIYGSGAAADQTLWDFSWSNDQADTVDRFDRRIYLNGASVYQEAHPNVGQWLTVYGTIVDGADPQDLTVAIVPLASMRTSRDLNEDLTYFGINGDPIGAGAANTYTPTLWTPGQSLLTVLMPGPFYAFVSGHLHAAVGIELYGGMRIADVNIGTYSAPIVLGRKQPKIVVVSQGGATVVSTTLVGQL